jgi:hypothetical protein
MRHANWSHVTSSGGDGVEYDHSAQVKILTDAIQEQSGVVVPPEAALTALYAVANYNYRLVPQKPEPHKYATAVHEGAARPEPEAKSGGTANILRTRPGRPVKIVTSLRARTQAAVVTLHPRRASGV